MNYRVFVRKKPEFRVEAQSLCMELKESLGIQHIDHVALYNGYDIFNGDENDFKVLKTDVLSELATDDVFDSIDLSGKHFVTIENIQGQYDQRADSAQQCLMLLTDKKDVVIQSFKLLVFEGPLTLEELLIIKKYLINPIETREKNLSIQQLDSDITIRPVPYLNGFQSYSDKELQNLIDEYGLAMTFEDLHFIQQYFQKENRDPSEAEIKLLDTYWSDHCRHTTFETEIEEIAIEEHIYKEAIERALIQYLALRDELNRSEKPVTLMELATIGGRYMRKHGLLDDLEVSDEINACSIEIPVDIDGHTEPYLLMFKNETHNHPTEIEPYGGASTCIGGAIRDPLSGRSYVYQAMRITGAGDITQPIQNTLDGKLPQSIISINAALGYSSYGNQIGLSTTFVEEIFHEGYQAKRMEVGAVIGAVPKKNVKREKPLPGDIVLLIGGGTGRDGIGGATGSSREHTEDSIKLCSSEVQKGNAPIERKLQRFFRNFEVTSKIKKSNDFGAGGVSVAVGELSDGLIIDLDQVPLKYAGLSGTEIAISESQERMSVLIAAKDFDEFKALAYNENLDIAKIATVTKDKRLIMYFKGQKIVDISREFLDSNGVRQYQKALISPGTMKPFSYSNINLKETKDSILDILNRPNVALQKGMIQMFDSSIGRSTVHMPLGGKYQLTPAEASIQKIPVSGFTNTCSIMAYGFSPKISEASPYLGGLYSVIEALARIVAVGGDYKRARLSCQEYFERLGKKPSSWGKPVQALLGLIEAQVAFGVPAIGGKDSMSGSFKDLHVPPTLITFAVSIMSTQQAVSPEFKKAGDFLYLVKVPQLSENLPDLKAIQSNFDEITRLIKSGIIQSVTTIKEGGIVESLIKSALGNQIGFTVHTASLFENYFPGSFVIECSAEVDHSAFSFIGRTHDGNMSMNNIEICFEEAELALIQRYQSLYPIYSKGSKTTHGDLNGYWEKTRKELFQEKSIVLPTEQFAKKHVSHFSIAKREKPKVLIPVFPGTNSEYDTQKAFERAGADVDIFVLNNLSVNDLKASLKELSRKINRTQILSLVGGFSLGDEPDGSGKFISNTLSNSMIRESIEKLLEHDGLILGICNGFQALIKSSLLPNGKFTKLKNKPSTLFKNDINGHISKIISTRITSNHSPWLLSFEEGSIHNIAISHGEGKFVVTDEEAQNLFEKGQIATQYVDFQGKPSMDPRFNPNGSYWAIEGLTSPDGRIFGKMGHSERYEPGVFQNIPGEKEQDFFKNGVRYFL